MQRAIDGKDGGAQTTQVVGSCFGFLEWCSLLFVVLLLASAAKTATETRLTSDYSILHPTPERPLPPAAAHFFAVKYHSGEQVELDAWDGGGIGFTRSMCGSSAMMTTGRLNRSPLLRSLDLLLTRFCPQ